MAIIITTSRSGVVIILLAYFCLYYVCMYCISYDNFRQRRCIKLIFGLRGYLDVIRIKFAYEDYRVKIKVTTAKCEIRYSCNVKLQSAITPVLQKRDSRAVCVEPVVFGYGGSNGVAAFFVT